MRVHVLRLGHRLVRDDRVTTHVGLVARAFGTEKAYFVGCGEDVKASIDDVTSRWGGRFEVELLEDWRRLANRWKAGGGLIVHLTMYGIDLDDVVERIRDSGRDLLIVVGAEKVPSEVYRLADFNIAVGHQPHSEVSALALFLDRFFRGKELKQSFNGYQIRVVPSERGKRVEVGS